MLSKKLKALTLTIAAAVTFSAVPASAADTIDLDHPDSVLDVRLNKPYLNFTVNSADDIDISKMKFSLQDANGNSVASFVGNGDRLMNVGEHMFDFTNKHSSEDMKSFPSKYDNYQYVYDVFYPDPIKGKAPSGKLDSIQGGGVLAGDGEYLTLDRDYYYYYTDKTKFNIVDTKTVPANTICVDVSSKYIDINDRKTYFYLMPTTSESQVSDYPQGTNFIPYDHAGEMTSFRADTGKYHVCVKGGRAGAKNCEAYDRATTYVKVRMKFNEAFPNFADDNLRLSHNFFGTEYYFDLRGDNSVNTFSGMYYSGAMLTAAVPDADGYVEFWVSDETLTTYLEYDFSCPGGSGGGSVRTAALPKSVEKINNVFEYPQSGFCLYNLPGGKYTLVFDDPKYSRDYIITPATIITTNSKLMQKTTFTVEKRPLMLGDCSYDGKINVDDIVMLAAHLKGIQQMDDKGIAAGDVDENGIIDINDLVKLAAHVKGVDRIPLKYL